MENSVVLAKSSEDVSIAETFTSEHSSSFLTESDEDHLENNIK